MYIYMASWTLNVPFCRYLYGEHAEITHDIKIVSHSLCKMFTAWNNYYVNQRFTNKSEGTAGESLGKGTE